MSNAAACVRAFGVTPSAVAVPHLRPQVMRRWGLTELSASSLLVPSSAVLGTAALAAGDGRLVSLSEQPTTPVVTGVV